MTYRIVSDHLGSPRLLIDATTGVVVESLTYDEFGNLQNGAASTLIPFGFAGGQYDASTGLLRFGARDYDSHTGRWTTKEPLGFAGGDTNLYTYVFNDPVNLIDPSGLDAITADPHALAIMASLFRKAGSGFMKTERSALILQNPSTKQYLCYSLRWSAEQNQDTIPIIKHPWAVALIHTHPTGRVIQADRGSDPAAAKKYGLPIYVLSRSGIHKYVPPNGKDSTEIDDSTYRSQNDGKSWFEFTDQDKCGCK